MRRCGRGNRSERRLGRRRLGSGLRSHRRGRLHSRLGLGRRSDRRADSWLLAVRSIRGRSRSGLLGGSGFSGPLGHVARDIVANGALRHQLAELVRDHFQVHGGDEQDRHDENRAAHAVHQAGRNVAVTAVARRRGQDGQQVGTSEHARNQHEDEEYDDPDARSRQAGHHADAEQRSQIALVRIEQLADLEAGSKLVEQRHADARQQQEHGRENGKDQGSQDAQHGNQAQHETFGIQGDERHEVHHEDEEAQLEVVAAHDFTRQALALAEHQVLAPVPAVADVHPIEDGHQVDKRHEGDFLQPAFAVLDVVPARTEASAHGLIRGRGTDLLVRLLARSRRLRGRRLLNRLNLLGLGNCHRLRGLLNRRRHGVAALRAKRGAVCYLGATFRAKHNRSLSFVNRIPLEWCKQARGLLASGQQPWRKRGPLTQPPRSF